MLNSVGQPLEKCGIPLSPSTPCTHFVCCLHLRRRLNQQMLQKRELLNVYSDSTQLLSSTPPPSLLSLIHEHCCEWSSAWRVGFGTQLWQHDFVHGEGEILSLKGLWYAAQEQEGAAHCCARQPLTHPEQRGERELQTHPTDWNLFVWTIHEIITKSNKKQSLFADDSRAR